MAGRGGESTERRREHGEEERAQRGEKGNVGVAERFRAGRKKRENGRKVRGWKKSKKLLGAKAWSFREQYNEIQILFAIINRSK